MVREYYYYFWSIGVIVTFISVTDKPTERNRDRPQKKYKYLSFFGGSVYL
jgi:hypothetical protein